MVDQEEYSNAAGYRAMANLVRPLGLNNRIPDQAYYNAGQKVAALPMVLGGLLLVVTGLVMTVSKYWLTQEQVVFVQWSITIHYITAGLTLPFCLSTYSWPRSAGMNAPRLFPCSPEKCPWIMQGIIT